LTLIKVSTVYELLFSRSTSESTRSQCVFYSAQTVTVNTLGWNVPELRHLGDFSGYTWPQHISKFASKLC